MERWKLRIRKEQEEKLSEFVDGFSLYVRQLASSMSKKTSLSEDFCEQVVLKDLQKRKEVVVRKEVKKEQIPMVTV